MSAHKNASINWTQNISGQNNVQFSNHSLKSFHLICERLLKKTIFSSNGSSGKKQWMRSLYAKQLYISLIKAFGVLILTLTTKSWWKTKKLWKKIIIVSRQAKMLFSHNFIRGHQNASQFHNLYIRNFHLNYESHLYGLFHPCFHVFDFVEENYYRQNIENIYEKIHILDQGVESFQLINEEKYMTKAKKLFQILYCRVM